MTSDETILLICKTPLYLERFWSLVTKTDSCWNWRGRTSHNGYPLFGGGPFVVRGNRLSFVIANNKLPTEVVRHTCDNRLCVNPAHLLDGTQLDNVRDRQDRNKTHKGNQDFKFCKHGHELNVVGFYINTKNKAKMCKKCILDSNRRRGYL